MGEIATGVRDRIACAASSRAPRNAVEWEGSLVHDLVFRRFPGGGKEDTSPLGVPHAYSWPPSGDYTEQVLDHHLGVF